MISPNAKGPGDIILTKGDKSDIPQSARLDDNFIQSFQFVDLSVKIFDIF